MVAGGCPCRCRAAHLGAGTAMDGCLGSAARLFSGAAAGGTQRAQPAGRADSAYCRGGVGAFPHAGLAGRQPLCTGAGCYRPERGRIHRPDDTVLPAGGGTLLRQHSAAPAKGGVPAAVGHPVAGRGRQGAFQRAAHRREYAGARLPCGVSGGFRRAHRRAGAVRHLKGHGAAAAQFPLWAAGQSGCFADAGDHAGAYRGADRPAERPAGPDAAAYGILLHAGGHAVLGVGQAAGAAALP